MSRYLRIWLNILPLAGLLVVAGFAFDSPFTEVKPPPSEVRIIDTAAPIVMGKCNVCHKDLGAFNNPKLANFDHPAHFKRGIRCESCHIEWPHRNSKTIKPTMDLCMNCHGLSHGSQGEAASGKCDLCHPSSFDLTPGDHSPTFRSVSHKTAAKKQANQSCLMCHKADECLACHQREGVDGPPASSLRRYPVWKRPSASVAAVKIRIGDNDIKMSDCNTCHTDLQLWKNEKLIGFNHPVHFERGVRCKACHTVWPHSPGELKRPNMRSCFKCHSLEHGEQKTAATGDCKVCHPQTMQLKPEFHTVEFAGGEHKDWAKNDRSLCSMCHQQSFCYACHRTEIPHPPGWKYVHGKEASSPQAKTPDGGLTCFTCHKPEGPTKPYQKAPSCAKCHKAIVYPHTQPWAPVHGKKAIETKKASCLTCHGEKVFCTNCHGVDIQLPHPDGWFGKHRVYLENKPIAVCMRCHQKSQCLLCHRTHKVHNQNEIYNYEELYK